MQQSYENHTQRVPFMLSLIGVLALAFIYKCYLLFVNPSVSQAVDTIVAGVLMLLAFPLRSSTLRVQDRVIRLEMRLRLREVLPASMHADIPKLTPRHLVALRFAGNDELPALVSEVIANPEITPKSIKQRIKNWQADFLRA